jgi:hypothetical protein
MELLSVLSLITNNMKKILLLIFLLSATLCFGQSNPYKNADSLVDANSFSLLQYNRAGVNKVYYSSCRLDTLLAWMIRNGGGGGTSLPINEIGFGTGSGITSNSGFYNDVTNKLFVSCFNGCDDQIYQDGTNHALYIYCNDQSSYRQTANSFTLSQGTFSVPSLTNAVADKQVYWNSGTGELSYADTVPVTGIYLPLAGGTMNNASHIYFGLGGQNISQGTFDNGTGGDSGISLNCAIGYELNWQGGHLTASYNSGANFVPLQVDSGLKVSGSLHCGDDSTNIDLNLYGADGLTINTKKSQRITSYNGNQIFECSNIQGSTIVQKLVTYGTNGNQLIQTNGDQGIQTFETWGGFADQNFITHGNDVPTVMRCEGHGSDLSFITNGKSSYILDQLGNDSSYIKLATNTIANNFPKNYIELLSDSIKLNGNVKITSLLTNVGYSQTDNSPSQNDAIYSQTISLPMDSNVYVFTVTIDGTGSPDTFSWTEAGGSEGSGSGVAITGSAQTLADGVDITFGSTEGHSISDSWVLTVTDQYYEDPLEVIDSTGSKAFSVNKTGKVSIVDGTQGAGNILTSDANGLASWQAPSGTFTPTVSDSNNVDGVTVNMNAMYIHLGNIVTVQYSFIVDATVTLTPTDITVDVPFNVNPSADVDGQGVISDTTPQSVTITPVDGTHIKASF